MLPCSFPCQEVASPLHRPFTETQTMRGTSSSKDHFASSTSSKDHFASRGRSRSKPKDLPAPSRVPVKGKADQPNLPAPVRVPVKGKADQPKMPKVQCKAGHGPECPGTGPSCQLATVEDFTQWQNHVAIAEAMNAAKNHGPWLCGEQSHTPTLSESSEVKSEATTIAGVIIDVDDDGGPEDSQFPEF